MTPHTKNLQPPAQKFFSSAGWTTGRSI